MPFLGKVPSQIVDSEVDIDGGTIDGATIGSITAGAGTFTNLSATGTIAFPDDGISGDDINGGTISNVAISGTTASFSGDLTVDTNTLYVDSTNNRVGINVADPDESLEVSGDIKADNGEGAGVYHFGSTSDQAKIVGRDNSHATKAGTMDFYTDGTSRIHIKAGGFVGINEGNPDGQLHIKSTAPDLILEDSNSGSAIGSSNRVRFRNSSGTFSAQIGNDPNINSGANWTLGTLVNYGIGFVTNNNTQMVLDSNGRLGIGDTVPATDLCVRNDDVSYEVSVSFGDYVTISAYDRVNATYEGLFTYANNHRWYTGVSQERMRITNTGLVGIEEPLPTTKLDVNGALRCTDQHTRHQAGGGVSPVWFLLYEKHYRTPNAYEFDIADVQILGGGQTAGSLYSCRLLIGVKQQQSSDNYSISMYEDHAGGMTNHVAYKYDSTGGNASNGLLQIWVQAPTNYMTMSAHVRRQIVGSENGAGVYQMVSTGSTTQPSGSTTISASSSA